MRRASDCTVLMCPDEFAWNFFLCSDPSSSGLINNSAALRGRGGTYSTSRVNRGGFASKYRGASDWSRGRRTSVRWVPNHYARGVGRGYFSSRGNRGGRNKYTATTHRPTASHAAARSAAATGRATVVLNGTTYLVRQMCKMSGNERQ